MEQDVEIQQYWHNRGYLPHFDGGNIYQSICYRLADSLPRNRVAWLHEQSKSNKTSREFREKLDKWLDAGYGSCILKNPAIAEIIIQSWRYHDGERYALINWTVMPNHVHVLIQQYQNTSLSKIIHTWKSYTAHKINNFCGQSGSVWDNDYWDRYIRDEEHFKNINHYIDYNPVKAGLANTPDGWPYSAVSLS